MKKFVFWSVIHNKTNLALTEDLSRYAQGETFWKAMGKLCEVLAEWTPSKNDGETDVGARLKMFQETGINKAEIFIEKENDRFAVKCGNSRSFIQASSEHEALSKYVATRAATSSVNNPDQ